MNHEERVIKELNELIIKIDKLTAFIGENKIFKSLGIEDQALLLLQHNTMSSYVTILSLRIDRFKTKE